jgi:hypothetical protein
MTITVESQDDLKAMRDALKDYITFFEADLTGFTTIRALRDAASQGIGSEIEYRALQELPWDEDWFGGARSTVEVSCRRGGPGPGRSRILQEASARLLEAACRRPCSVGLHHNSGAAPSWSTHCPVCTLLSQEPPPTRNRAPLRTSPSPFPSPSPSPSPSPAPPALNENATTTNATTNATVDAIGITNTTELLNATAGQLLNRTQPTNNSSNSSVDAKTTSEAALAKTNLACGERHCS